MDICAGIVLYNPSIEKLNKNISAIISQVRKVVLVDNGSNNIKEIEQSLSLNSLFRNKIEIIKNQNNLGIGKALNQILDFSIREGFDWFLTLDQDSICRDGLVDKYITVINQLSDYKIGQITCNIEDEKLGEIEQEQFLNIDFIEVSSCITSGCINNVKAVEKVGRFNEKLFIDGVDIEISLRLREYGFSVLKINYDGLKHSLGEGRIVRFLGVNVPLTYHAPWRSYYMRRNFIYIAKRYYSGIKKITSILKQIGISVGTVFLEDHKADRIKYCTKGIIDGFKM